MSRALLLLTFLLHAQETPIDQGAFNPSPDPPRHRPRALFHHPCRRLSGNARHLRNRRLRLLRELEIYVQAGMTPLEAIQSDTIVAARAMKLDVDSGTVEAGKRADLILSAGDPLANISGLRRVTRVVVNGSLYNTADLCKSVGFRP